MASAADFGIDTTWTWSRGPVSLDGDALVYDVGAARAYVAAADDQVLWDIVRIEEADDALRIARKYGSLRPLGSDRREAIDEWMLESAVLYGTIHLQADLSPARLSDPGGLAALRARWGETTADGSAPKNDRLLLFETTSAIVEALNRGLAETQVRVVANDGDLRIVHAPTSLLGLAYLQLARLVAADDMIRRCLECGRVFPVQDRRQRYCSERHASRARLRRFRQGRRDGEVDAGETNGVETEHDAMSVTDAD